MKKAGMRLVNFTNDVTLVSEHKIIVFQYVHIGKFAILSTF